MNIAKYVCFPNATLLNIHGTFQRICDFLINIEWKTKQNKNKKNVMSFKNYIFQTDIWRSKLRSSKVETRGRRPRPRAVGRRMRNAEKRDLYNCYQMNETQKFMYVGYSNWTICRLNSWFCSKKINFLDLYTRGSHFLLAQGEEERKQHAAEAGNGKKGITQKWMRHRCFCTWGIQTWPFADCLADFVPKNFHFPKLYTGGSHF